MIRPTRLSPRILVACLPLVLSACAPRQSLQPSPSPQTPFVLATPSNPYAPQAADSILRRAGVQIMSANLVRTTDSPAQVLLLLSGWLPTQCHQLRVEVLPPDRDYRLDVNVYSVVRPNQRCEDVLASFDVAIALGEYSAGIYTVWVNGGRVGDFNSALP